jgi:xanthosine utilization system XapX-like protein
MRAAITQRALVWLIVLAAMKVVPWWFRTVAHVLAIVFAMWVGIHYQAPVEWIVIYTLAAVTSAALPAHRVVGFVGLCAGIIVAAWGAYLLRDSWKQLSIDNIVSPQGGVLGGGREAVMLALAGLWLVLGSAFRTQRG